MAESLTRKISTDRGIDVSLITCIIIKTASQRLKPGKTDRLLCVTSAFFVNAPSILYDLMKGYFIHGDVGDILMLSTPCTYHQR